MSWSSELELEIRGQGSGVRSQSLEFRVGELILTQRRRGAESVDELLCLCSKILGCAVVMDDILRTPGLFLNRHLRCESCLGFRKRHSPCRHHPFDLLLPRGDDAAYYIKIFLPVCFEEEWDYRYADSWCLRAYGAGTFAFGWCLRFAGACASLVLGAWCLVITHTLHQRGFAARKH